MGGVVVQYNEMRRRVIHLHRTFIDFHGRVLFSQCIVYIYDLHDGGCSRE